MSEEKEAAGKEAPKSWKEMVWQLITGGQQNAGKVILFLTVALTSFNPELRSLAMTVIRVGWDNLENYADDLRGDLEAAMQAFALGFSLLFSFAFVALLAAATNADDSARYTIMGSILLFMPVIGWWMYWQCIGVMIHIGAIIGFASDKNVTEANVGGIKEAAATIFSGTGSAVKGAKDLAWGGAKKFGWILAWILICGGIGMVVPFHNRPYVLWLEVVMVLVQIHIHNFREQKERGVEWDLMHWHSLLGIAAGIVLSAAPWLLPMIQTKIGTTVVLVLIFLLECVLVPLARQVNKERRADLAGQSAVATPTATPTPTPVSGMDHHHQPKTNYALRAIGPAFLLLMVVAICATIIFLNIQTEGFQKIIGPLHL